MEKKLPPITDLTGVPGARIAAPQRQDTSAHFSICPVCGQSFDARKLKEVLYHKSLPHQQMAKDS